MISLKNIPRYILGDAARNLGWREKEFDRGYNPDKDPIETYLSQMRDMTPKDIFGLYCNRQGLIDYGDDLWNVMVELQKIKTGETKDV